MRRVALLFVLLMLPLAAAQGQASLELSASTETLVVSRESSADLELRVVLRSDNPFDTLQPREVRIETGQTPPGWIVRVTPERQDAPVDTPITFTVQVDLTTQATESEVPVTFTAILVPRGAEDTPIGGQIDPETESAPVTVTLKREDPLTREVLENVGPWIWVGLGVLAVAVLVLAVVLTRGNKPTVDLSSRVKGAMVAPGRSVAIPVTVENLSSVDDTVVFHVAPMPTGWAASLPVPELALDGKQSEELHLVVTSPPDASIGEVVSVGISANGVQNPKRVAELVVDVKVVHAKAVQAAGGTKGQA